MVMADPSDRGHGKNRKGQEENGDQETPKKQRGGGGAGGGGGTFRPPAKPYCFYCQVANKPPTSPLHYLSECPFVTCHSRSELVAKFCDSCKANVKFCVNPSQHTAVAVPDTFVGAVVDLSPEFTLSAATWEEPPLFEKSKYRGKLESQTLLTSEITLLNGDDSITVQCLWDSGSESSFFHPGLLPFALQQRKQSF